jgi:hypothetical protein
MKTIQPRMIHDIAPIKDQWGRGYSHLEFLRGGLARTFSTRIPVWSECMRCGFIMTVGRECSICGDLSAMEEDAIQQGDYNG